MFALEWSRNTLASSRATLRDAITESTRSWLVESSISFSEEVWSASSAVGGSGFLTSRVEGETVLSIYVLDKRYFLSVMLLGQVSLEFGAFWSSKVPHLVEGTRRDGMCKR